MPDWPEQLTHYRHPRDVPLGWQKLSVVGKALHGGRLHAYERFLTLPVQFGTLTVLSFQAICRVTDQSPTEVPHHCVLPIRVQGTLLLLRVHDGQWLADANHCTS